MDIASQPPGVHAWQEKPKLEKNIFPNISDITKHWYVLRRNVGNFTKKLLYILTKEVPHDCVTYIGHFIYIVWSNNLSHIQSLIASEVLKKHLLLGCVCWWLITRRCQGMWNGARDDKVRTRHRLLTLQWRHNEPDGISYHQPYDCLINRLFKAQIRETIKAPRHWPLCGEFTGDWWIPRTKGQ